MDSDDEDKRIAAKFRKTISDIVNSYDLDNCEISIKIKWEGVIEKHSLRKHQRFGDLIEKLAVDKEVDVATIILMLDSTVIEPEDTPDSIGYSIAKFLSK